ncbi:unnamed protein product [Closterium sp. NIES-53]
MATPSVLTFDAEGRAVDFEVWLDDLQLFLQCDRADGLSLFDLTSGVSPAPPATADSTVRSQWATRDAAARLAVRRHLPTTERAHFSQYRSAQTLLLAPARPSGGALSRPRLRLPHWDSAGDASDQQSGSSQPYWTLLVTCSGSTSSMGLVLGGRRPVVLTGHADASWADDQATQRSSQGYTFSLGSGSVSWRSTRSSSVLRSSCEAEIYAGAMAAQELRWLTYLLTDLGEQPRSPPVLYVDNKAMLALCREHRLEHRTKHIALRYLIARELQQRGQLRLAYVASEANTADIFTKALAPGDHQRFCTLLAYFALLDWL